MRIVAFLYSSEISALANIFLGFDCHKTGVNSSVDFTDVEKCVFLLQRKCVCVCVCVCVFVRVYVCAIAFSYHHRRS